MVGAQPRAKKVETRSSSGKPTRAPKRVSRVSGKAPDSYVRSSRASATSTAPMVQSVSSFPGEQYPFFPYIDRELDLILDETSGCLDGAMSAVAASVDPVVSDMSFRPLTLAADAAEFQPLTGE